MECRICPHECGADRRTKLGVCRAPDVPEVALAALHHWEEPAISGTRGSGTIFFAHCNLACVFCQNWDISQGADGKANSEFRIQNAECRTETGGGKRVSVGRLREIAFDLKAQGAHNINLVSPTPYSEMLLEALLPVKPELAIPIVWNTNAYELVSELERLESLVDVYLPDIKFQNPDVAKRYCGAADYFQFASRAIGEMVRQKSEVRMQKSEVAEPGPVVMTQGVIIRHLVIPGQAEDSKRILEWIADAIGTEVHISLMAQYTPVHRASEFPEVNRRLRHSEYEAVCDYFCELGFENGWVQELSAASSEYTPEFDLRGT
jgi:putative pyruvate formate lyase activating enzyme